MSRIIETQADITKGATTLAAGCEHMAGVYKLTGLPPLRRRPSGFAGLARIITGQQLSVASAGAIWGRVEASVTPMEPGAWLRKRTASLRKCGLSAGKVATIGNLAQAITSGSLDLEALDDADEHLIRQHLTALKGIGPWTADIYIMFCLGRADGWAPGDLALRHAVRDATGADEIPDISRMDEIAEAWRPWRGVAARMLWAYYDMRRSQKGGDPVS